MYPVKPTMIPKLEFSFVTSQEKFDIMTSVPEKTVVETVGQQIKDNRSFRDRNTKIIFDKIRSDYFEKISAVKQNQLLAAELAKQRMPFGQEELKRSSQLRMAGELDSVAGAYGTAGEVAARGIRQPTATFSV